MIIFKIILFQKQCAENPANRKFLFSGVRTILTPIISYIPRKKKKLLEIDWRMNLHRQWTYDSSELSLALHFKGFEPTIHHPAQQSPSNSYFVFTNKLIHYNLFVYKKQRRELPKRNYNSESKLLQQQRRFTEKNTFSSTQGDKMLIKLYY